MSAPEQLRAISFFYYDFRRQVSDEAVVEIMKAPARSQAAGKLGDAVA